MPVDHSTMEEAVVDSIDLGSNAFMIIHGWTAGPLLLEFVAKVKGFLGDTAMTAEELGKALGLETGPLAILLRTCSILGYVTFDVVRDAYTLVRGLELDELEVHLSMETATAEALRNIYSDAMPPFKLPSPQAERCFQVWESCRPSWQTSKSKILPILLDGIVLAPLLVSITYYARWNEEGLDFGKEKSMDSFDFSGLNGLQRTVLSAMLDELGVGKLTAEGTLTMNPKGSLALQRCYSYFVPTSYSPMMAHFNCMLVEEPGWGFLDPDMPEIHVKRTLNVVGSGAQHQSMFKDMMRHINVVFGGEDFEAQPKFVADTGCGDGHLLMHIYEHVKRNLPRGQVLDEYPLTMIGIDFNEESRMATAINLASHEIPHLVHKGDIGKPAEIINSLKKLKKKKIDVTRILHVRSFLDHDRPYIPPAKVLLDDSVTAAYARTQMADFVHLDKEGNPIKALEVFASLVEHFERWANALEDSFGLCLLEVMMLDVPTTKRFFNDCVSFHFDIVQCLSRQYMISSAAFVMGAAMAGLFPANYDDVQTYPEQGKYCRVLNQHLVRKPFKIRCAEISDLPTLVHLESVGWKEHMRATEQVLKKRLETSPTTCFVCEMAGKVVAIVYLQKIASADSVDTQKFMDISSTHDPTGRVLQLIGIVSDTDPAVQALSMGTQLRNFVLHLARVDPGIDSVVGVTRAGEFKGPAEDMKAYVDKHVAHTVVDPVIGFHTGHGASVVRLVPDFRPEDTENAGIGVLIQYNVKDIIAKGQALVKKSTVNAEETNGKAGADNKGPGSDEEPEEQDELLALDVLKGIMDDIGFPVDDDDLSRGFFNYGMDSLEMVRIRNRLGSAFGLDLSTTLLLDYPNVKDLAMQLDKERGIGAFKPQIPKEQPKTTWDTITDGELLFVLEKFNKFYALPQYQTKLQEAKQKHDRDMPKYLQAIETVMCEVEGPVLLSNDVIKDSKQTTVQNARTEMAKCVKMRAAGNAEIRAKYEEFLHLTKQG